MSVGKYSPTEQLIAWAITSFDLEMYRKGGYVHVRNDPTGMSANVSSMFFHNLKIGIGDMIYYSHGKPHAMPRKRFDELFTLTGSVSAEDAETLVQQKTRVHLTIR